MSRIPLLQNRRGLWVPPGTIVGGGGGGGSGTTVSGPYFNDVVANKTTGTGGDYPDGIVNLSGGTWYMDPFDMSGTAYKRSADGSKPNNNWLTFREADGPGTVFFDLRPESSQNYRSGTGAGGHQTQSECYNDTTHGGAFRAQGAGSLRWCFDGGFTFQNGQISLGAGSFPGAQRIIFHGSKHKFPVDEWRRQYDIIRALRGTSDPGASIPNDSPASAGVDGNGPEPNGGPYWRVYNEDTRWKGNNQPTPFRCNGAQQIYIIRCDIGPAGDDAVFGGIDLFSIIGCSIHEVGTANGANLGSASAWFHPDIFQSAGGITQGLICDTTFHGHLNLGAEFGHIHNLTVDRVWQGMCGIIGGIVYKLGGWNANGSSFGSGAPDTPRITGHFYKGFSNGMDHNDGGSQVGHQVGDNGWHCVLQDYGDSGATISTITLAAPAGVTFGANGLVGPSGFATSSLSAFLGSTSVPDYIFKQAYATSELATVMSHYGISFD